MTTENEYKAAVAKKLGQDLAENPFAEVSLDPDIADFMGAFTEDAIILADLQDDTLLSINEEGEVFYNGGLA